MREKKRYFVVTQDYDGKDPDKFKAELIERYTENSGIYALPSMKTAQMASLIVEILPDGRTNVIKNRWGDQGRVVAEEREPKIDRTELVEDLKQLLGLPPFNEPSNINWGDAYFGKSLERKYGRNIPQLRKMVGL